MYIVQSVKKEDTDKTANPEVKYLRIPNGTEFKSGKEDQLLCGHSKQHRFLIIITVFININYHIPSLSDTKKGLSCYGNNPFSYPVLFYYTAITQDSL